MFDEYIKIAGDHPSREIGKKPEKRVDTSGSGKSELAKKLGVDAAELLFASFEQFAPSDELQNAEMGMQKELILSFTALSCFENEIANPAFADIAHNAFLEYVSEHRPELYSLITSSGAFSFYYLAFRRGIEVDRRMGQTFAMLCGHDGDPVYQELGEALYCWFYSKISKMAANIG